MSDPNDQITIDIKVNGELVDTVTRRPVPEYGTQAWDDMIREVSAKAKTGSGQ